MRTQKKTFKKPKKEKKMWKVKALIKESLCVLLQWPTYVRSIRHCYSFPSQNIDEGVNGAIFLLE